MKKINSQDEKTTVPLWKTMAAVLLSLVFAGLGHLILKEYLRGGVFLFVAFTVNFFSGYYPAAILLNFIIFIFSAFDAFSIANRGYPIV